LNNGWLEIRLENACKNEAAKADTLKVNVEPIGLLKNRLVGQSAPPIIPTEAASGPCHPIANAPKKRKKQ